MGRFCQFSTALSARHMSKVWLPDNNLCKYQLVFIKLGMCIYIVELCQGLLMGKFCQVRHMFIFFFPVDNLSKYHFIFTKLGVCIDILEIWFGIANGHILPTFDSLPTHNSGRILSFHLLIPHYTIVAGYYGVTLEVRVSVRPSVRSSRFCILVFG